MIVQCDQCQAKYRIDDAKIGEKGVKVRCTKCQNSFIVKKEAPLEAAAPPPPPAPPAPPEPSQPSGFSFDVETSKPSEETQHGGQPFGLTGSGEGFGGFGAEEKKEESAFGGFGGEEKKEEATSVGFGGFGAEEKKEEAPAGGFTFGEAKPSEEPSFGKGKEGGFGFEFEVEKKGTDGGKQEETVIFSIGAPAAAKPAAKAKIEAPAAEKTMFAGFGMGEEKTVEPAVEKTEVSSMAEAPKMPPPAKAPKAGSRKGLLAIVVVILVLGGGFALYTSGLLSPVIRMFSKPAAVQTLEIEGVKTSFVTNEQFGQIFVIEGVVVNLSDGPQEIKFINGVIYDDKQQPIAEKTVSAGRTMSVEELTKLSQEEIERYFSDTSPSAVPPKGTIPVMIVFTELPSGMAEIG
ncbi:MAG: DUF3426 domain-containing protein, partial [Thermodesulfobacteriota bacterium]